MKTLCYLTIALLLTSCEVVQDIFPKKPKANFSIINKERGKVLLANNSQNAYKTIIDWGDNTTETDFTNGNVEHVYPIDGNFVVKIKVEDNKKNKNTDVAERTVSINNTEGDYTIYLATNANDRQVNISINGSLIGTVNSSLISAAEINCNSNVSGFGVKGKLKTGVYNISAISAPNGNSSWSGTMTIFNDKCTIRRLQ